MHAKFLTSTMKPAKLEKAPQFSGEFKFLTSTMRTIHINEKATKNRAIGGLFLFANFYGKPVPDYLSQPSQEELLEIMRLSPFCFITCIRLELVDMDSKSVFLLLVLW